MAAEAVIFQIEVQGAQAKRELGALRGEAMSLGGGLGQLNKRLDDIGGKTGNDARKALGSLSFAMGGLGNKAGEAVNMIGDLAGAFAGGPFVAAVAGAGIAVAVLGDKFDIFGTKAAAAAKKAGEHFDGLKQEIKDLDDALQAMATGKTIERIRQQAIVAQKELAAKEAIEAVGGAEKFARLAGYEANGISMPRQIQTAYEAAIEATKDFALENKKLADIVRNAQFDKYMKDTEEAATRVTKAARAAKDANRDFYDDTYAMDPSVANNSQILDALRRPAFNEAAKQDEEFDRRFRIEADYAQRRIDLNQFATDEMIKANQKIGESWDNLYGDALQGALGNGISAVQGFIGAVISGEEHAAEKATAAFLSSTGNQLVGIGTKAIFEGAAISANPLTPGAGAGMIGVGIAAIGAGIGMGAGAAAITASLPSDKSTGAGARDRGVNSGRRSGGSGSRDGEGFVINVTFAGAGPAPEQVGAAIKQAIATSDRRQGVARVRQGPLR